MNRIENLKESLHIIEGLCLLYQDSDMKLRPAVETIDEIYRISHLYSNCKNLHMGWRTERSELEKKLITGGYIADKKYHKIKKALDDSAKRVLGLKSYLELKEGSKSCKKQPQS